MNRSHISHIVKRSRVRFKTIPPPLAPSLLTMHVDVGAIHAAVIDAQHVSLALARERLAPFVDESQLETVALALVYAFTILSLLLSFALTRRVFGGSSGGRSRSSAIVIMGTQGCGKTCAWQALRYGEQRFATCTSVAANDALDLAVVGKDERGREVKRRVRLVDVPGHAKLRLDAMDWLKRARAVVFVVDSVSFANDRREVAQFLFEILSDEHFQRSKLPLMVVCNKSEKLTAHSPDFIRKRLEREVEAARRAAAGSLPDMAVSAKQRKANQVAARRREKYRALGQRPGEEFTFEAFARGTGSRLVTFDRISATKLQMDGVRDFIARLRR